MVCHVFILRLIQRWSDQERVAAILASEQKSFAQECAKVFAGVCDTLTIAMSSLSFCNRFFLHDAEACCVK